MTDIASLGLEIRSDGVVVAKDRLKDFRKEAGLAEAAAGSLKRLATMGLAALAAGFAAFGVGIGAAVKRMEEMDRLTRQVDQALKNSGNSARTSASEIEAWADSLERRTGRAAEEIMGVSANLASFGFSREAFFRSLELADDMSAAWGGDLKQNLEGLARALAEPEKGLAMLTKRGITFTDEQKKMIAAFVQTNDLAGAQGVVFDALEAQVKGVAEKGFGGLEKAMHNMQKAWEDAFEDLVSGDGQAGDLRDTLVDLAQTVSSPEFINAVMGFGGFIVQAVDLAAKAIIGLWGKIQEFMGWLKSQQPGNMGADDLQGQLEAQRTQLERYNTPGNRQGLLGMVDATPVQILDTKNRIAALEAELRNRSNPTSMNVNGIVGGLGGQTYDSPEAMWRGMSPGTMGGQTAFNPYEGMALGGSDKANAAEKARKAYDDLTLSARQFIDEQTLEVQALGMTEEAASRLRHEQDLLNKAANDNLTLSPQQREELRGLAEDMATTEENTRRLTDIYETGKSIFNSFFSGIKSGITEGKSLWDSLANAATNALDSITNKALEMAANGIFDMLFGSLFGGGAGGATGGGGGLGGIFSGLFGHNADGTDNWRGGMSWVGERGPELVNLPKGAQVIPNGPSMAMAANNNIVSLVRIELSGDIEGRILEQSGAQSVQIVRAAAPGIAEQGASGAGSKLAGGDFDSGMSRYGMRPQAKVR